MSKHLLNEAVDELSTLKGSSEKQIWLNELALLRKEYTRQLDKAKLETKTKTNTSAATVKKVVKPKA